ncbi:hypothetical protein ASF70_19035 [Rhizobium sp. Leaf321]|uniref:dCTP deaminase domain-containing protein n=1 Tax=Rhizobium sp. Leaf321 TaxID=1736335 RepID=UPI0007141596|nr:hypothetical protein [Rhizobium sp. Leaf321]KQQ70940.1 hypothetical protein ASF70_19035 [Rhizobium sp. Leaf321]
MTLNDRDIDAAIRDRGLITNSNPRGLAGACYELRMGSVYYDLTEGGKRFALSEGEHALIKPGHRVVLITAEELNVPPNLLVRIISKGALFSIGLSPVSTYADPGFAGNLGIVTQNISDKYIVLPQGEPIAKADFTQLSGNADRPYHGQHGFQAGIWPIKAHLQKEYSEVSGDSRVESERQESLALLPSATRTAIERLENTLAIMLVAVFIAIALNAVFLFLVQGQLLDQFWGIVGNLASSAIIGIASIFINSSRRNR